MLAARDLFPALSYPEIGRFLGKRDHTTIMYGARVAQERLAVLPDQARLYDQIIERVQQLPRLSK
jgi:chromosomal replication initiation ATPase DnaA